MTRNNKKGDFSMFVQQRIRTSRASIQAPHLAAWIPKVHHHKIVVFIPTAKETRQFVTFKLIEKNVEFKKYLLHVKLTV